MQHAGYKNTRRALSELDGREYASSIGFQFIYFNLMMFHSTRKALRFDFAAHAEESEEAEGKFYVSLT